MRKQAPKNAWITIQVPLSVKDSLAALAKTNEQSLSAYVRLLLKQAIKSDSANTVKGAAGAA